ncbi:MAG: hypothetical protein ACI4PV_06330 [Butyricicoccus sp.]
MKKRIVAALLAVCMALTLTACGGKKDNIGSFGATSDKLITALRKDLTAKGYEEMFAEDPEPEKLAASDGAPETVRRSYIAPGMVFEVYSLASNDEVYQAVLMVDKTELKTDAEKESLDIMLDLFTTGFEKKEREKLFEDLSLPDTEDGIDKQATGTEANWVYFTEDGFLLISATSIEYAESIDSAA